jgi:hypothetical protein
VNSKLFLPTSIRKSIKIRDSNGLRNKFQNSLTQIMI